MNYFRELMYLGNRVRLELAIAEPTGRMDSIVWWTIAFSIVWFIDMMFSRRSVELNLQLILFFNRWKNLWLRSEIDARLS